MGELILFGMGLQMTSVAGSLPEIDEPVFRSIPPPRRLLMQQPDRRLEDDNE